MKNIILLGPPGSGKGTQSKILVDEESFLQISTGDILRKKSEEKSQVGIEIKEIMQKGLLVSDEMVIDMIVDVIDVNLGKNFIFDGFPRNIIQAKALDKALIDKELKIDYVIFLDVKLDILEERIRKRIDESNKVDKRLDDNIDTLLQRVKVYQEMTLPLLNHYKEKKILSEINGMMPINLVSLEIKKIIN